ncbi:hypothetical protein [Roseovarius pelagicus]|uniref:Uncharacterized protein n=1 Tax=Roseovarius pelagicus TaxID=2980108 RepID=A0ABY6D7W6_9RHOB|nr:hypothetical protein [Roseovarius pelagicus]UXX82231.1 hypothetical protein N7U68_14120 [Roseovarius pelagicus]
MIRQARSIARKLIYRVSVVSKWGIAEGMCVANPATADALALPRMERNSQHH